VQAGEAVVVGGLERMGEGMPIAPRPAGGAAPEGAPAEPGAPADSGAAPAPAAAPGPG
jgi:hypothetical protein